MQQDNTVLLHACCAPCSAYPLEKLASDGFLPVVYFANSNIYPKNEYDIRLNELVKYTQKNGIESVVENYNPIDWYEFVKGYENEPEKGKRCTLCFEYRLRLTALKAKELAINKFTTTLTVSPHKNSKVIFETAQKIASEFNIEFLNYDFKKQNGFLRATEISKAENFYRQKYCGCKFSIPDNLKPQL